MDDLYARLGLSTGASPGEVRQRFRDLARQCHPDAVAMERRAQAHEAFIGIREAYRVLSDPQRRRAYDATLSGVILPGAIDLDDPGFASDPMDDLLVEAEALLSAGLVMEAEETLVRARALAPEDTRVADMLRSVRPPGAAARVRVTEAVEEATGAMNGPPTGLADGVGARFIAPARSGKAQGAMGRPDGIPAPFEPLQGAKWRMALFCGGLLLGLASIAYPHIAPAGVRWLGLGRSEVLSVWVASASLAFALDIAALIRPFENEIADDIGAASYGPLLWAAGAVHLLLAAAAVAVYATMNERWTYSTWLIIGVAAVCATNGIVADPHAWRWGVAALGNVAFVGALSGWLVGGLFRRTHFE